MERKSSEVVCALDHCSFLLNDLNKDIILTSRVVLKSMSTSRPSNCLDVSKKVVMLSDACVTRYSFVMRRENSSINGRVLGSLLDMEKRRRVLLVRTK